MKEALLPNEIAVNPLLIGVMCKQDFGNMTNLWFRRGWGRCKKTLMKPNIMQGNSRHDFIIGFAFLRACYIKSGELEHGLDIFISGCV